MWPGPNRSNPNKVVFLWHCHYLLWHCPGQCQGVILSCDNWWVDSKTIKKIKAINQSTILKQGVLFTKKVATNHTLQLSIIDQLFPWKILTKRLFARYLIVQYTTHSRTAHVGFTTDSTLATDKICNLGPPSVSQPTAKIGRHKKTGPAGKYKYARCSHTKPIGTL